MNVCVAGADYPASVDECKAVKDRDACMSIGKCIFTDCMGSPGAKAGEQALTADQAKANAIVPCTRANQ